MSYSNYRSYLNKRVNKVNCCCERGPQGLRGMTGTYWAYRAYRT